MDSENKSKTQLKKSNNKSKTAKSSAYSLTTEERIQILANLIIDKILAKQNNPNYE